MHILGLAMESKVEVIRKLDIYKPIAHGIINSREIKTQKNKTYFAEPHDDFVHHQSYHFPVILLKDGSPWPDGNRYLLHKTKGIMPAKHRTLDSIARDLIDFRRWLDNEEIDYLYFSKRTWGKPTYKYCSYLHEHIKSKKIALTTAKRRMQSIQGFYRWLELDGRVFKHSLWRENDTYISFKNHHGFIKRKNITKTDLTTSFRTAKNTNNYSNQIEDGGKLRPLTTKEQYAIVQALKDISNIEMTLAFLIALTTGARLQTVFTLRKSNFESVISDKKSYIKINTGAGTPVNTKYGKQIVLFLPHWLFERAQIYISSQRYSSREKKSPHIYPNIDQQYAFLTRGGKPYYMANDDPFESLYRTPPRGNAITLFIRQQLLPQLKKLNQNFTFRFHDLRATFGLNLLKQKFNSCNEAKSYTMNDPELLTILMYLKERMGHSDITTTMRYINYNVNFKTSMKIQNKFEKHLQNIRIETK